MNRDTQKVLVTQFLTAFADNAILFIAITMIMQVAQVAVWYVPAMQAAFLLAFVVLAPWVGNYVDKRPKATVMTQANIVKGLGAGLLLLSIEPLIAYAIVGLGAAFYGPSKYGILPEIVEEKALVKANGWIEGSTIIAIVTGMIAGAKLAEYSIDLALALVLVLYALSAMVALLIKNRTTQKRGDDPAIRAFVTKIRGLFATPRARFSTLGVSLFWATATVLRLLLVAFVPVVFLITESSKVAELTVFVAIGIAIGSMLATKLIPLAYLRRARLAAYAMGVFVILLSGVTELWTARAALLLIGISGGMFVVPINAALQEIGHKTIGSGNAVAVQNFFQSFAMLVASGLYSLAAGMGADPIVTMVSLGVLILMLTLLVTLNLPPDTGKFTELEKVKEITS